MTLPFNCGCYDVASNIYFTPPCSSLREANPVKPPNCIPSVISAPTITPSLSQNSGGMSGFSLTDPFANSAVSRQRGRGFASVASGFLGGLQSVFGGGQQAQQQVQPTAPTMPVGGTPPQATSEQPKGWIPFAVIGGIAIVGVLAYVAIKRRK